MTSVAENLSYERNAARDKFIIPYLAKIINIDNIDDGGRDY